MAHAGTEWFLLVPFFVFIPSVKGLFVPYCIPHGMHYYIHSLCLNWGVSLEALLD